jgi:DNA polymerase-3 subunit delta'
MYFENIPGKGSEKSQLIQQVQKNKIAHAQLFLGKEGFGGLALALAFSRYVFCTDKQPEDACGQCDSCKKFDHYAKPDLHFVYPMVKYKNLKREDTVSTDALPAWREAVTQNPFLSLHAWIDILGAEGSTPNINVRECNDIMHKLSLMSFDGGYKILILWLPEYLGKDGNRLLKLIEEPPDQTLIIFVSEDMDAILTTIISRCQVLRISPFDTDEITGYIHKKYGLEAKRALEIANMSDGNIRTAIQLCNHETKDYSDMLISWFRIAFTGNPVTIQEWYQGFEQLTKNEKSAFIEYGLHFLRQCILFQLSNTTNLKLTEHEKETIARMQKVINIDKATAIIDILERQLMTIPRNANLKIMFLTDSLSIGDIMNGKEIVSLPTYSY